MIYFIFYILTLIIAIFVYGLIQKHLLQLLAYLQKQVNFLDYLVVKNFKINSSDKKLLSDELKKEFYELKNAYYSQDKTLASTKKYYEKIVEFCNKISNHSYSDDVRLEVFKSYSGIYSIVDYMFKLKNVVKSIIVVLSLGIGLFFLKKTS